MSLNKSAIIERFTGQVATLIVHIIIDKSSTSEEMHQKYVKEINNSLSLAKKYRNDINPIDKPLHSSDIEYIKQKIYGKVKSELQSRTLRGYKNIQWNLINEEIEKTLKELNIN